MKWYEGLTESYTSTPLEKHRMSHIRARVRYERDILLGVIMGLIFVAGVIVGRML